MVINVKRNVRLITLLPFYLKNKDKSSQNHKIILKNPLFPFLSKNQLENGLKLSF